MPGSDRVVAIGLLTADQVRVLGTGLRRYWPIDEAPRFDELLRAIDEADVAHRSRRHETEMPARR